MKNTHITECGNSENWGSRFGFIMATAGFAIGLGNIWRFPYLTGMDGGGAFLLVYVAICLCISAPLLMAEISLGRKTQCNPITGMRRLTRKGSPWVLIGWFGGLASLLIMSYYLMIIGWIVAYIFKIAGGAFNTATSDQIAQTYTALISNPAEALAYTLPPAIFIGLVVTRGLANGIEKCCKIMMPLLFLLLIILAVRSVTLPGSMAGLEWYLRPDFSKITGKTLLDALGQSFFSIGVGFAAAFTYGSYLDPKNSSIPNDAALVVLFDTLIAFIAGLVIFPALFSFNMSPDAGPGLIFLTMPKLFVQIPGGIFFGLAFFILLLLAALSTGVGLLEAVVAIVLGLTPLKRKAAVWLVVLLMVLLAIPSILSQGPWSGLLLCGKNCFDLADFVSGSILLPGGALLLALYTAYVWKFHAFRNETNAYASGLKIASWLQPLVCYLIPAAVTVILIAGLF